MAPRIHPLQLLLILLLAAVAVSGWIYGWHWKQVAVGTKATHEERLLMELQDQLDLLRADNEALSQRLRAEGEPSPGGAISSEDAAAPPPGDPDTGG